MDRNERGWRVGNQDGVSLHINVDLAGDYISGEILPALVCGQGIHLFDFLLFRFGLDVTPFKPVPEGFYPMLVHFGLVNSPILNFILLFYLV